MTTAFIRGTGSVEPMTSPSRVLARAVDIAIHETWVRETDGKNDSPRIREYQAVCGLKPPEPYCGCFVAWCILKACTDLRAKLKARYYDAYTPEFYKRMPIKLLSTRDVIQRGDLFFVWSATLKRISHVGFVRNGLTRGWFDTVEANTNPQGSRDGDGVYFNRRENTDHIVFARFTDDHVEWN
jgi:hypothetical protein